MDKKSYEKIYDWGKLKGLVEEFLPELVDMNQNMREDKVIEKLPLEIKEEIESIGFSKESREPEEVARQLLESVYPYRMKVNHPRYFCFIPNGVSPLSIFGDFLNSMHNPYGGGFSISEGVADIESETIKWMGEKIGYDREKLGGQFVSGGSMANLTAAIVARDEKLKPEEFFKGTVYVSDQTHSSVAKAIHIMGIPRANVRKIETSDDFKMKPEVLKEAIEKDLENGFKPFLLVATAGTTNTGTIDPLRELALIARDYGLWYHVDGAYGASAILSSHREILDGIDLSDSVSWDGHKWLYQSYGCAAVICKDKKKMVDTFHVNPEYLKDVESTEEDINFWDMGIELTKPARGVRLWYTLQSAGIDAIRDGIDEAFRIAEWIEDEVKKYDDFEIISRAQLGAINFRFFSPKYSEEELDEINRKLSMRALEENYAAFLTTELKGKIVLRFCAVSPLTKKEEVEKIIADLHSWTEEYR